MQINPKDWKFYFERPFTILMADVQFLGESKFLAQELEFNLPEFEILLIGDKVFLKKEIHYELISKYQKKLRGKDDLKYYIDKTLRKIDTLVEYSKKFQRPQKNLLQDFDDFLNHFLPIMPYFWIPWLPVEFGLAIDLVKKQCGISISERDLHEALRKTRTKKDYLMEDIDSLNKITNSIHPLLETDKVTIKQIKNIISNNKEIQNKFVEHVNKFNFLNTLSFKFREPYDVNYYLNRLLYRLKGNAALPKREKQILISNNKIDPWVAMLADLGHTLDIGMEKIYLAFYNARPLFKSITEKLRISLDDLSYLLIDEVRNSLIEMQNEKILKKIDSRKRGWIYLRKGNRCKILTDEEYQKISKKFVIAKKRTIPQQIIVKGIVANPGHTKGLVRIIKDENKVDLFRKGEILVCPMTTPTFVPAIEKTSAIVTDEGGLLCHAAIISRELNKPCIIATKIATQVLKDGDLVEVDANKGIVKILQK